MCYCESNKTLLDVVQRVKEFFVTNVCVFLLPNFSWKMLTIGSMWIVQQSQIHTALLYISIHSTPFDFVIQIDELKQKTRIELNRPLLPDMNQGVQSCPVMAKHHVSHNKSGRSWLAKDTVDKYFSIVQYCFIHKFHGFSKMPEEKR